ncbi:MAG TPA: hypothetical protein VNZ46_04150, partial [Pedobacter sp.]|nr:hypothetical protein [Pedobacter sp.]
MALLKDLYCPVFYNQLSNSLSRILPEFDPQLFLKHIYTDDFQHMELKQRMRHTTHAIHEFLPSTDFPRAAHYLTQLVGQFKKDGIAGDLVFIFL